MNNCRTLSTAVLASSALVSCLRMSCISDCMASLEAVTSLTRASRLAVRRSSSDTARDKPACRAQPRKILRALVSLGTAIPLAPLKVLKSKNELLTIPLYGWCP